jgi:hypothetical protein
MGQLGFEDVPIDTKNGKRSALLVTPRARLVLGQERLARLRANERPSELDDPLYLRVKACSSPPSVVVFRAKNDDGTGWWGFDPQLSNAQARELAKRLARTHVENHRRPFAAGVLGVVHTDYGLREAELFRAAESELAQEEEKRAEKETGIASALAQLNTWTLRTLSFTYTLRAQKVIADLLSSTILMLERSAPMVKEMLAAAAIAA